MTAGLPQPNQLLRITRAASEQFAAVEPFNFRVIAAHVYGSTPHGCAWIEGYQLDDSGDAVERRSLFVQLAGLITVTRPAADTVPQRVVRRARNTGPRLPRPRTPADPITPTRRNR
jgi:hypothetical protein